MKITELKNEMKRVLDAQSKLASGIDKTNPTSTRNQAYAEGIAEFAQAVLSALNGDRIALTLYQ